MKEGVLGGAHPLRAAPVVLLIGVMAAAAALADGLEAALREPPAADPLSPERLYVPFKCNVEMEGACELLVEPAHSGHVRVTVGYVFAP